jgi:Arc/MetJ-type ribon-helix-helix transcriptional regulator
MCMDTHPTHIYPSFHGFAMAGYQPTSSLTMVHHSEHMSASNKEASPSASVSIGAKIAPVEARQIRELIEAGVYLNESDFVRDAIRHRLSEIKVIKCRDVDYETAKKEILGYYKSRGEAYPDEAALDLELDFDLVMKATEELRKEGRLVEA